METTFKGKSRSYYERIAKIKKQANIYLRHQGSLITQYFQHPCHWYRRNSPNSWRPFRRKHTRPNLWNRTKESWVV
jgi:hypothetical protein